MVQNVNIEIKIEATAEELPGILKALRGEDVNIKPVIKPVEKQVAKETPATVEKSDGDIRSLVSAMIKNKLHDDVKEVFASVGASSLSSIKAEDIETVFEKLSTKAKFYGIEI